MTLVPAPPKSDQSQIVTEASSTFQNKPWRGRLWGWGRGPQGHTTHPGIDLIVAYTPRTQGGGKLPDQMAVDLGQGWDTGDGDGSWCWLTWLFSHRCSLGILDPDCPQGLATVGCSQMGCQVPAHQCPPSASCTPFTNHMDFITQTPTQMWTAWEDHTCN